MPEVKDQVAGIPERVAGSASVPRAGVAVLPVGDRGRGVALAGGGIWLVMRATAPVARPTTTEIPALQVPAAQVAVGSVAPVNTVVAGGGHQQAAPEQAQGRSTHDFLGDWAGRVASMVGIPARALVAYGNADLAMRASQAGCKLSWASLAGIGRRIESNHGQYGAATLGADGRPSKPIIGVPLDGSPGVKAIGDTDRGDRRRPDYRSGRGADAVHSEHVEQVGFRRQRGRRRRPAADR
jgi:hypothetical protein